MIAQLMNKQQEQVPSPLKVNPSEVENLIAEIKANSLSPQSRELMVKILVSFLWLSQQLAQKRLSIHKLLKLFFGSKTEKSKNKDDNNKDQDGKENKSTTKPEDKNKKPVKGHGKNGSAKFENAKRESILHPTLKAKDICPGCEDGKLYEFGFAEVLRLFGQPPLIAKIYELARLRCANCQELFTAPLPEEAGNSRHHESANAMVGILNYGSGMPFYRLEALQKQLGTPLADATQFDMAENLANCASPIFNYLKTLASFADQQGFDDTPMPILSLMKENKQLLENERKGMQTSAIMATSGVNKIALFMTGRQHAGENIGDLLKKRDPLLSKVIQMSDASANNFCHAYSDLVIKALCMDHGRRNFYDLLEAFPQDCRHVIKELGIIYKNDDTAKVLNLTPLERLHYHQKHSAEIMNNLNTWMEEKIENKEVEPNSELGKAIDYFTKHWNGLTEFLRTAGAPLSNAEVERLVKRCVLRRKASLFYKTQAGAWIGDILMSVIETCRFSNKNTFEYLVALQKYAFRVKANPEHWLPWNYEQTLVALS